MGNNRNYSTIARESTKKTFFEKFIKTLRNGLTKYFGEEESKRVMEALSTGRIEILNIENFLYSPWNVSDRTLEIYKNAKTADDFFYESLAHFKKLAESGNSHIEVREFIIAFVDMLKVRKFNLSSEEIENYVKIFLYSLMNMTHESPFYVQLLSPEFATLLKEKFDLGFSMYHRFIGVFLETYRQLPTHSLYNRDFLPHIEILYPVFPDVKSNQIRYLATMYSADKAHVIALFKNIEDLSVDSLEFNKILDTLENETGKKFNRESLLLELNNIKEKNPVKMYPCALDYSNIFNRLGVKKSTVSMKSIKKTCVNKELFGDCLQPYFSHIEVDCSGLKNEELNYYIDAAKSISLLRIYFYHYIKEQYINGEEKFRITLKNVQDLSQDIVNFVHKKVKQLKSLTNKDFIIDICYDPDVIGQKWDKPKDMYVRVISDIHADYNQNKYTYNFGDDFVINCGDTGGEGGVCVQWNTNHVKHGIVIAGNHLGYSKCYPELSDTDTKNTKNNNIHFIAKHFTGKRGILFMSNSIKEYEGVVILGTTLYTDFALYGEDHVEEAMQYARNNLNDFRYVTVPGHREYTRMPDGKWDVKKLPKGEGEVRLFTPQDHAYYFNFSYKFLQKQVKEYKYKPIIIVTHHAPSPYSISPEYAGSMLNPAFASNLNEFIISNPQIRLWCHGHCIDDETEVLTTSGWKTFKNIKQSDILLNLNTLTNTIEEDTINAIISKNYSGEVYHFHSKGTDLRVTDEHDMLTIYRKTKKITKIKAKDLYNKKQKFLIRAGLRGNKGLNLSDNLLRLLVWISADGNRPNPNTNLIRFNLYKERKIERLKFILDELKIPFKKYVRKNGSQSINFYLPSELQDYSFKPIDSRITHCNKHQCRVILEEYVHTDGYKPYNSYMIYTSKKAEADSIQLMCITNEYGCSISTRVNHGFKLKSGENKVSYELNIVDNPYRCLDNPHRTVTVETVSNEHFWCLNTNNGTLIVRRNGKVNITGNCHNRFDYILGGTRVVCDPFGYNNENNVDLPYNYGTRIRLSDIKSGRPWTDICFEEIQLGLIKVYEK